MDIQLHVPAATDLDDVVRVVGEWHTDKSPFQLHPGDIGWFGWHGDDVTAAALRTWARDGRLVAVGLLDGPGLLRLALAPDGLQDDELALAMAEDIAHDDGRVLPPGPADVEAPCGAVLRDVLAGEGWTKGDPWTHLRLDLTDAVDVATALRIEVVDEARIGARTAVHRAAFGSEKFTDERWRAVAAGPADRRARSLGGFDGSRAVAAITVWSAGQGRPGIIEPMGVHPDHRGHGHGVAITRAAAAALRDLGSSSVVVGTPSANAAAVTAYSAAGLVPDGEVHDLRRAVPPAP